MFKFLRKKIGIIGYGNMGSAIAERIKSRFTVYIFDKDSKKTSGLSGLAVAKDIPGLIKNVDVVILAVKPQDFETVLNELKDPVKGKLVISIAAGISTSYIERCLGDVRVVRTMPNLPASIGKGCTNICQGRFSGPVDISLVKNIFDYVGETVILKEDLMDAATAISGSGPGFFFSLAGGKGEEEIITFANQVFLPKLEQAAINEGFDKEQARILSSATTAGSLAMLAIPGNSAEMLRIKVTSPNGTTEAGLKKLQNDPENLFVAVKAAKKRAEELSKKG